MVLRLMYLLLLMSGYGAHAQTGIATAENTGPFTLQNIDTWKIHSDIIGDDYTLYVLKTADYDTTSKKLPVLYMTDGDWNMTVAMNCFSMLRQDYATQEPLIVGIGYGKNENKRVRDLDPKTGGPEFLSFIEKEVMPFINKNYRTSNERAVYGYSMGGMFTTYVLFNRPDLFQKIFIGAPGNNGYDLMPAARKYFESNKDLKSKVFIGVGSFEREVVRNIDSFTTYLASKKCADLEIESKITPDAGHGAGLAEVMQDAIAFGYCKKHKPVAANVSLFEKYAGNYVYFENEKPVEELNVYTKDKKLFLKWKNPRSMPLQLMGTEENAFYDPANERVTYRFAEDHNKPILIFDVVNDKKYILVKSGNRQ